MTISRRQFGVLAGAGTLTLAMSSAAPSLLGASRPRVVVIGGGAAGATAARYIAKDSKGAIDVTLIEPSRQYYTCFFSNIYLGGFRPFSSIAHSYETLATAHGINVVHDWAEAVDRDKKSVVLASGARVPYDRLVVAPGIDIKYDSIPGYSVAASQSMPHAWKSGTEVALLKHQVENMKQGGTFVYVPPPNPFRCPPGPYERISMIAHNFKQKNPDAKIIVLDPKPKFSKQSLFQEGWDRHYPGMIEWYGPDVHGGIKSIDAATMSVVTDFDTFKADAASVVPAQKAGAIAAKAGLTNDGGWCPINPATMQSQIDPNIHIVGDASIAAAMPKSAFSANSQAKSAAMSVRAGLIGAKAFPAKYANTCWSLIASDDCVKIGGTYKPGSDKIEPTSSFISKPGETAKLRAQNYKESVGWYDGIIADMFG